MEKRILKMVLVCEKSAQNQIGIQRLVWDFGKDFEKRSPEPPPCEKSQESKSEYDVWPYVAFNSQIV